ncbi:tyrosine-type recombinase/integrase [Christensenella sp.]|uniref:tyrosine-type recombinase/integrase n=1 Tax=Christensenella sp. TaxID=1935934 RepID=UPI002B1EA760|nr:hypothetical protein [Christensenella sp.]
MKLTPHTIQHFYNKLLEAHSPKTVKNTHGILSKAINQAVALAYIPSNPSSLCTLPKGDKPAIHPLDSDTLPHFLSICQSDTLENLFIFAIFTGLRRSEIICLTWDFETSTIYIHRQLQPWREIINGWSPRTGSPEPSPRPPLLWICCGISESGNWKTA